MYVLLSRIFGVCRDLVSSFKNQNINIEVPTIVTCNKIRQQEQNYFPGPPSYYRIFAHATYAALPPPRHGCPCLRWHILGQSEGRLESRDRGRDKILASFWHYPRWEGERGALAAGIRAYH